MLIAKNESGNDCEAWLTSKSEGPFYCRDCDEKVILRKGKIREHHYAHTVKDSCSNYVGESNIHRKCKREIYTALSTKENCSNCNMELKVGELRPDICLRVNGKPVIIEVQRSSIDIDIITKRTTYYRKKGISVLWILPEDKALEKRFNQKHNKELTYPKKWQLFLHQMYYGRIYIWSHESFVKPIHLSRFEHFVPKGNWVEETPDEFHDTNWYNDEVGHADYGGYTKTSKTQFLSNPPSNEELQTMDISKDFDFVSRKEWVHDKWIVPSAYLLIDKQLKWW